MNSSTKAWILMAAFSVLALIIGHSIGEREGLLWAVALSLSINSFVYLCSDQYLDGLVPGRLLEGQDPWGLLRAVESGCKKLRLPMPTVLVIDSSAPQALVWGRSWKRSTLAVTQGLLDRFEYQELEAVVTYQLACIHRLDSFAFNVSTIVLATLTRALNLVDTLIRWMSGAKQQTLAGQLTTRLMAPLMGAWLKLTIGTKSYFLADQLAVKMLENPQQLAKVLWKLDALRSTSPYSTPLSCTHHFIVNPLTGRTWSRYFHVQPSAEKRIRSLIGYYPI